MIITLSYVIFIWKSQTIQTVQNQTPWIWFPLLLYSHQCKNNWRTTRRQIERQKFPINYSWNPHCCIASLFLSFFLCLSPDSLPRMQMAILSLWASDELSHNRLAWLPKTLHQRRRDLHRELTEESSRRAREIMHVCLFKAFYMKAMYI